MTVSLIISLYLHVASLPHKVGIHLPCKVVDGLRGGTGSREGGMVGWREERRQTSGEAHYPTQLVKG